MVCTADERRQMIFFLLKESMAVAKTPCAASTMLLDSSTRLVRVHRDFASKKDIVYLVVDRSREWVILCQSLPLVVKWINENISNGDSWDRVTVTGLFESLNRTDGRNGGWHKGRFRVCSVPLTQSRDVFEGVRTNYANAAVVSGMPNRYETLRV